MRSARVILAMWTSLNPDNQFVSSFSHIPGLGRNLVSTAPNAFLHALQLYSTCTSVVPGRIYLAALGRCASTDNDRLSHTFPVYYSCPPLEIGRVKGACYDGEINWTNVADKVQGSSAGASHLASPQDRRSAVQLADTDASCSGPTALGTATKRGVDV